MRVYLTDSGALAYYVQEASPAYWERHWQIDNLRAYITAYTGDRLFVAMVRRYLPGGAIVLEGGCGRGQVVHALRHHGYRAIGLDFAAATVGQVKAAVPELTLQVGDVRALPIASGTLDGYVSAGVIEHFWDGYTPILREAQRVLRPGGYFFLSFPFLNPLRRTKQRLGLYPQADRRSMDARQAAFYQFALGKERVVSDAAACGFVLREALAYDGIKGLRQEAPRLGPLLQQLSARSRLRLLRAALDRLVRPFAGHGLLLVLQRQT